MVKFVRLKLDALEDMLMSLMSPHKESASEVTIERAELQASERAESEASERAGSEASERAEPEVSERVKSKAVSERLEQKEAVERAESEVCRRVGSDSEGYRELREQISYLR